MTHAILKDGGLFKNLSRIFNVTQISFKLVFRWTDVRVTNLLDVVI